MAEFLKVNEVLDNLDLKDSMSGAEFGCGSALFTVALAKKLSKGRVCALDIQEEKLSALQGRLSKENINNVKTILADLEAPNGSTLKADSLDVVLIPNVLFQAENKYGMINEAVRILKKGGELLIIDWLREGPFSPRPKGARLASPGSEAAKSGMISPEEMKKIAESNGLSLKKEFMAGDYHYALLFSKK